MKQFYNFFKNRKTKKQLRNTAVCIAFFFGCKQSLNAQVSAYSFAQSTGTYVPITGTIIEEASANSSAGSVDNKVYPITLPFSFAFNGVSYNTLNASSNGFVTFGATAPSTSTYTPISSSTSYEGAISVWGKDLNSVFEINGVTGNMSWEMTGTAPNREIIIQWKNFRPAYTVSTSNAYVFSFQVRLQETSNVIKMVYNSGAYLIGATAVSSTAQIGLRGFTTSDFNNRLNATTLEFINSTSGTANSSSQAFNTVEAVPGMPSAGLTYTWTPPTCLAVNGLAASNTTNSSATLTWPSPIPAPAGYDIYYSTTNTPPTSSTAPTNQNVTGNSLQISQLTALTTYYGWIRSNCGSGEISAWSSTPLLFMTQCNPPSVLTSNGATVCPGQPATLSATVDTGATVNWYDSQTNGNLLATGNSYTTPALTSTTDYFVSASNGTSGMQVGKDTYTANPSSGGGTTNFGLVFDALATFTLESVTIYPVSSTGASGTVTIDIIDGNGTVLNTKTVNVVGAPTSAPVAQVVDLNFTIFPGTNYKIRPGSRTGITGLLFDPSANAPGGTGGNYGYPFTLQNLVTIKTSTLTAAPVNTARDDLYYYFYDWKVGTRCESARTTVTATADAAACLSTSEADAKETIKVYPNPFSEVININKAELVKSIKITDVSGKMIRSINQPESTLRLQDLSQGMYILILDMKDGTQQSLKVIKK